MYTVVSEEKEGMIMGRTKEFDHEQVLHKAMLVFWEKGYEATSIPDLVKAMGISRSSMYETFVDKETLYVQAFKHYKRVWEKKRTLLRQATSVKEGVRQYFEMHIAGAYDEAYPKGCLVTNTIVSADSPHQEFHQLTRESLNELERIFYELLKKGQQSGEIGPDKDIKVLASLLLHLNHGINVMARSTSDRKAAEDMIAAVIEML
ncbi:TetR/AcrR family transcriptional regulator [Paenibacillus jiagnxiensis]|uniref:TetR/AcrR family transcriptional regulator n=1 Tax=Paenibacillus jiagnxiensis TaxID=3228926 RepID=UPI0038D36A9B